MAKKSDKTWVKNQSLYDSGKAQEERQQKILSGEMSWVQGNPGTTSRVWNPATDKPFGGNSNIGVVTSAQDRRRAERENGNYARWKAYNEGYPATPPAGSGLQQLTLDTAAIAEGRKKRQQAAAELAETDRSPRANVPRAASVTPETDYVASQRNMHRLGKDNVRHTGQPEVMGDTLGEWFTDPLASLYDQVLTPTGDFIDRAIIDPIVHPKKAKIREQNRAAQNRIAQEASKEDSGVDLLDMTDKGAADAITGLTGMLDMTLGNIASAAGWKDNIFRQWNDLAQASQAANQSYFDNRLKNAGKVKKFIQGELVPQLVSMLPDLELAFLSGGGSVALEGAGETGLAAFRNRIFNAMASPAWWSAFVREAGTGYNEEIAKGESEADAAQYAILTGWINAMIEMSGGVQDIPANMAAREGFVKTVLGSAVGEAMEEPAQSMVSQIIENYILQRGNPVFSMEDENAVLNPRRAAHEALLAGTAGALMGAPTGVNNAVYNQNLKAQNAIDQLRAMAEEAAAQESQAQERPAPVTVQAAEAPKVQMPAAAPAQEAAGGSGPVINNPGAVTPTTGEETARNAEIQEIAGLIDQIARQRSAQEAHAQTPTAAPVQETQTPARAQAQEETPAAPMAVEPQAKSQQNVKPAAVQETAKPAAPAQTQTPANVRESNKQRVNTLADNFIKNAPEHKAGYNAIKEMYVDGNVNPDEYVTAMRLYYESGRETPGKPFTGKKIAPPLTLPQAQAAYRAGQIDAENQAKTTAKAPETVAKEAGKAYTVNRESESGKAAAKNVDTSGANGYDALKNALNSSSRVTTADGLEYTITGLNELTYDMNTGGRSNRTVYRTRIRRTGGDKLGGSISNARDEIYSAGPFDTIEEAREDLLATAKGSGLVGKGATNGLGREQGAAGAVHDGGRVLQSDELRPGDRGVLDNVAAEDVPGAGAGARQGQSVPADQGAGQGADAPGGRAAGAGTERIPVERDSSGAVPVRAGAGDDGRGRGRGNRNGEAGTGVLENQDGTLADALRHRRPDGRDGLNPVQTSDTPATEAAEQTVARADAPTVGNYVIPAEGLKLPNGEKSRFNANFEAIRIAKQCALEGRRATAEEQEALSKFVGWGGLSGVFEGGPKWAKEQKKLKALLTEAEYAAASKSTMNAHYTSIEVVRAMYDGILSHGVKGGSILEPSSGTGNFIGAMPDALRNGAGSITMVELDPMTAQIAALLYPDADVRAMGFEKAVIPNNSLDLVVGNVPFGNYPIADPNYPQHVKSRIHNYFIVRSLDLLKPGGTMCIITSAGTLNAGDNTAMRVRQEIADRANLVGAIRLPNTAFKGNAGTEVVTDILVLQKRAPGTPYRGENFLNVSSAWTETDRVWFQNNEYFEAHPEMVLGTTAKGTMYGRGSEMTVNPKPGKLTKQIEKAFASIKADLSPMVNTASVQEIQEQTRKRAQGQKEKNVVRDGKIFRQKADGSLAENKDYAGTDEATQKKVQVLTAALELRDTGRGLLELQMNGADDAEIQAAREKLNRLYDSFVKKHGYLNQKKNADIIDEDGDFSFIRALETVHEETQTVTKTVKGVQKQTKKTTYTYSKADIFTVNTVARSVPVTHVDTAAEAISVSMNMRARLDVPYIAQLLGKSESATRSELINNNLAFLGGNGELIPARIYLSGNVRAKLRQAEGMAQSDKRYERNVKALREVIPADIPAEKISATVGVPWIPLETYAQFINETLETSGFVVTYDAESQSFAVVQRGYSRRNVEMGIAGDAPRTFSELYEQMFTGKPIQITREGKILADATRKARARQKEIQEAFTKWLWSDEGRRNTLGKLYNDTYNAYVDTVYDGVGVHPAGLAADVQLKPHQAKAVQRALQGGGNVLLAHATGAGKTLEIASIIMEGRRLGIFSKPMVVVPKNVLAQWPIEFRRFFPGAKILAADEKNFSAKNRNGFLAQAMNGDWDAIIVSYQQFQRLPMSAVNHRAHIEQELAERRAALERSRSSRGGRRSVKNEEKNIARLEAKLEELDATAKREQALETFDGLGIDGLFVDEFHNYKNLGFYSKLDQIVGLSKTNAIKTEDMLEKIRYLQAHNGGRGVVVATATPLTNAINEVYTMQRYLQPDLMNSLNLMDFDSWAKQFCVLETIDTTAADGSTRKQATAMTAYQNVPELSSMFRQCADVERHPPVGKLPTIRGGKYTVVEIEPTEFQTWYMSKLPALLQEGAKDKDSKVNPLTVQGLGRNLSVSRMLVDKNSGVDEGEKLTHVCSEVVKEYNRTSDEKGTQLIFLDKGVPGGKYNGALYKWIKERLVQEGIPRNEIADIYEWESKKDELSKLVNAGEIRVVIGSYMKLGVGINLQTRLSAIHLADIPYRPADLEQAVGRGIRQGNMNEDVAIMAYVTKNTFDTKSWDTVLRKARINSQIMDGTYKGRSVDASTDDITNFAELTAIASGDTRMTKQLALSNDVESLRSLQQDWEIRVNRAKEEIGTTEADIARTTRAISAAKADAGRVQDMSGDKFRVTIGGKTFDSRKDAGEAVLAKRDAILKKPSGTMEKLGTFSGFDLYLTWSSENPAMAGGSLILRGNQDYQARVSDSAVGTMTALGNTLAAIERDIPAAERYIASLQDKLGALQETAKSRFERAGELERLETELARLNEDLEQNPPKLVKDDPTLDAKFGDRIAYIAETEDDGESAAGSAGVQAYREVERTSNRPNQFMRDTEADKVVNSSVQKSATTPHPEEWTTTRVGEDKTPKRLSEIIEQIHHEFRVNITTGKIRGKGVRGQHSTTSRGIRTKLNNDLPTIAHELGHHLDLQYEITDGLPADMKKELVNGLPAEFAEQYPEDALPGEGMAEFIRRYLQNSAETAAAYPKFTEHFMNAMSDQDRARFVTLADEVNAYMGADPGVSGNIRPLEEGRPDFRTPMEKLRDAGSTLYQAWVDAQHGVKRFADSIGNNRAYIKATNAAYADARASQTVFGDLYDVDAKWIGPGLAKSLQGLDLSDKKTVALFNEYLVVKHAPERTNDDGEMLDVFADSRYNNPAWLKTRQGQIERQHPEFAEISERLYEFEQKFLQTWAVDTGLIPETVAKTWANRWQYYVPFYRVIEKGGPAGAKRAFSNQDAGIRKARGSGRDIIAPLDGIISQVVRIVNAGVRNDVMRTITDYAEGMGADAAFLEKVPTPLKVTTVDLSDTKALLQEMLGESDLDADAVLQAQSIVGSLDDILKQYGRGKAGGNVVYVMKNGKPEFWKINDPGLLDSITNLSTPKLKGILDAYAQVSRFMTANITGRNVIWSLFSNSPIDLQALFTYAPTKNPLKLFRGIGSAYLNKAKGTNADPLFLEYLAMGGGEASYYTADRDMAKKARTSLAKAQKRFNLSANPLDWIGFISDTIECGPRYSVYKYLRQKGVDAQDAFYASMDVTVNFRRGGRLSRDMNKLVPFFNAGVQGLDKFARWITAQDAEPGKPRSRTARNRAIGWVTVSAVLAAAFYALNNRDKEHKEDYQQLSNYTKNNFWCIPIGDGKYFAIPKPRELAVLSSLLETTMERTAGGNEHAFDEFYEYFTDQCLPNMLNDLAKGDIYGTIGQLGIVGVGSYMMANRDFLGRPIESNGMKYYEPKDRYNERTSKIAYWLGQAFGVSPVMLDYFFQQTLGGFWKTQKALFPVGKSAVDPTLGVLNTYIKDNQYSQDLTNWLYDKAEASAQAAKSNPNDGNLSVTAKMDARMTEFYGRYYKLAKTERETTQTRGTRQTVLTMIQEWREASDTGYLTPVQKAVYDIAADYGTDYLPGTMQTYVKDENKEKHPLSAAQYVEYQTNYLRIYWEIAEEKLPYASGAEEQEEALKEAKKTALAEASEAALKQAGF